MGPPPRFEAESSLGGVVDVGANGGVASVEAETRLARKRAQKIANLERAAARLFAEKGFDATGFEDIASALDLRGPSLYHYFSSKEELFLRCVHQSSSEVMIRLQSIAQGTEEPKERLYRLFREQVLIELRDYPEFVPLFFRIYLPVPALREKVLALRREHAEIFEGVVRELLGRPSGSLGQARVQLEIAFGALAYLPEWYDVKGPLSVDQLGEGVADSLTKLFL